MPTHEIYTYLKLKKSLQKLQLYPFEFPGAFIPKPPAENGIPKKSLHMLLQTQIPIY